MLESLAKEGVSEQAHEDGVHGADNADRAHVEVPDAHEGNVDAHGALNASERQTWQSGLVQLVDKVFLEAAVSVGQTQGKAASTAEEGELEHGDGGVETEESLICV